MDLNSLQSAAQRWDTPAFVSHSSWRQISNCLLAPCSSSKPEPRRIAELYREICNATPMHPLNRGKIDAKVVAPFLQTIHSEKEGRVLRYMINQSAYRNGGLSDTWHALSIFVEKAFKEDRDLLGDYEGWTPPQILADIARHLARENPDDTSIRRLAALSGKGVAQALIATDLPAEVKLDLLKVCIRQGGVSVLPTIFELREQIEDLSEVVQLAIESTKPADLDYEDPSVLKFCISELLPEHVATPLLHHLAATWAVGREGYARHSIEEFFFPRGGSMWTRIKQVAQGVSNDPPYLDNLCNAISWLTRENGALQIAFLASQINNNPTNIPLSQLDELKKQAILKCEDTLCILENITSFDIQTYAIRLELAEELIGRDRYNYLRYLDSFNLTSEDALRVMQNLKVGSILIIECRGLKCLNPELIHQAALECAQKTGISDLTQYLQELGYKGKYVQFFELIAALHPSLGNKMEWKGLFSILERARFALGEERYKELMEPSLTNLLHHPALFQIFNDDGSLGQGLENLKGMHSVIRDWRFSPLLTMAQLSREHNAGHNVLLELETIDPDFLVNTLEASIVHIKDDLPETYSLVHHIIGVHELPRLFKRIKEDDSNREKLVDRFNNFQATLVPILHTLLIAYFCHGRDGQVLEGVSRQAKEALGITAKNPELGNDILHLLLNHYKKTPAHEISHLKASTLLLRSIGFDSETAEALAPKDKNIALDLFQIVSAFCSYKVKPEVIRDVVNTYFDTLTSAEQSALLRTGFEAMLYLGLITNTEATRGPWIQTELEKINSIPDPQAKCEAVTEKPIEAIRVALKIRTSEEAWMAFWRRSIKPELFLLFYHQQFGEVRDRFVQWLSHTASGTTEQLRHSVSSKVTSHFPPDLLDNWHEGYVTETNSLMPYFEKKPDYWPKRAENILNSLPENPVLAKTQKEQNEWVNSFVKSTGCSRELVTKQLKIYKVLHELANGGKISLIGQLVDTVKRAGMEHLNYGMFSQAKWTDLSNLIKQLQRDLDSHNKSSIPNLDVSVTADPETFWNSMAVLVPKSCQHIKPKNSDKNKALSETLTNETRQILTIRSKDNGHIEGRALVKLGVDDNLRPALVLEPGWLTEDATLSQEAVYKISTAAAIEFAARLKVPVVVDPDYFGFLRNAMPTVSLEKSSDDYSVFTTDLGFDYEDTGRLQIQQGHSIAIKANQIKAVEKMVTI
ncbi:MAG: hypothetical protein Q8K75_07220 [Chlamydiales bacterium]|nr:hypothetical protein [Chlamydiales bacterium]